MTKTEPRHWVVSSPSVQAGCDNWLPELVNLLAQAHGEGFATDYHFGKAANRRRTAWMNQAPGQ